MQIQAQALFVSGEVASTGQFLGLDSAAKGAKEQSSPGVKLVAGERRGQWEVKVCWRWSCCSVGWAR